MATYSDYQQRLLDQGASIYCVNKARRPAIRPFKEDEQKPDEVGMVNERQSSPIPASPAPTS